MGAGIREPLHQPDAGALPLPGIDRVPFPAGAAVISAALELASAATLSNSCRALRGAMDAMGAMRADERLFRLVPRRSSVSFEKLPLAGAPLPNRTVDLLLTI
jgi:hypothetical protein